jgi:hypothetical protein
LFRVAIFATATRKISTRKPVMAAEPSRNLLSDPAGRRGAVAIQVALMPIVLIGVVSLGSEVVLLFAGASHMQAAADSAAAAGSASV